MPIYTKGDNMDLYLYDRLDQRRFDVMTRVPV